MSESTNGLPDVQGLEAFVSGTQDKAPVAPQQQAQEPPKEGTDQQPPQGQTDLAQFKTPEALLKSYKELQGAFTKTAQEKASLLKEVEQIKMQIQEQAELTRLSQMNQFPPQPAPQKDFDQMFIENPQKAVESLAEQKAQTLVVRAKIQEVLEEENLKNPDEFGERYAYVKLLSNQHRHLVTSTAGMRKLFQMADKLRAEQIKAQADKAVRMMFGEDIDMEKFKSILKKDASPPTNNTNLAYMPDSSTTSRTGLGTGKTGIDSEIQAAAAKGDVESTIANIFNKALGA